MSRVLMVCTGNICRSPLAALLLRERLGDELVGVASAGTRTGQGFAMTRKAARSALALGVDAAAVAGHRSTPLTTTMLDEQDLVLTMTRAHRRAVVSLAPRAVSSTFTLREFARLAAAIDHDSRAQVDEADPRGRLRALLLRAQSSRGSLPFPSAPDLDDIADPYRRSAEAYARAAEQIEPAVDVVARVIRLAHVG
ncbi:hypothetical protein QL996_11270 [Planococcus sp. APC 4015]|nr:hypothetical protein [Planococcus sp. APC 4015]